MGSAPARRSRPASPTSPPSPASALLASFRGQEAWAAPAGRCATASLRCPARGAAPCSSTSPDTIPDDDPDLPALLDALGGVPLAICLTARRAAAPRRPGRLWAEWQRIGPEVATWQGTDPARLTSVPHSIALSLRSPRAEPGWRTACSPCSANAPPASPPRTGPPCSATPRSRPRKDWSRSAWRITAARAWTCCPRCAITPGGSARPAEADAARWCRHFLDRARTEGGRILGDGGAEALADLTPEIANIDAALRAAPGLSLREPAVAALGGAWRLLSASGAGSPAALDALARACAEAADTAGEAACHRRVAPCSARPTASKASATSRSPSDHDTARARYEEALPLYRRVGAVLGEANCIKSLGDIALARSDHDTARARYEEALPLYRRVGDVLGEATASKARRHRARPLRPRHGAGALRGSPAALSPRRRRARRGQLHSKPRRHRARRSDHDTARARYEEALPLYRRVGDVLGEAICFAMLGQLARAITDLSIARTQFLAAVAAFRRVALGRTKQWRWRILPA